jgi:hypothetical protein
MCGKAFEDPMNRPELDNHPQNHPAFRGHTLTPVVDADQPTSSRLPACEFARAAYGQFDLIRIGGL